MTRFPAPMCVCGHDSKQHAPSAKARSTPRPCLVAGCGCEHFKNAPRPEAGK